MTIRFLTAAFLGLGLEGVHVQDSFELRYGIGVLYIHEYAEHSIYTAALFDSIGERQPHSKWVELAWSTNGFWSKWNELLPFSIHSSQNTPFFLCMEQKGDWFRVRLKGNLDYWVRQEDRSYTWHGESV